MITGENVVERIEECIVKDRGMTICRWNRFPFPDQRMTYSRQTEIL